MFPASCHGNIEFQANQPLSISEEKNSSETVVINLPLFDRRKKIVEKAENDYTSTTLTLCTH